MTSPRAESLRDSPDECAVGLCGAARLKTQDRAVWFDRPARRLVTARDALQIHSVLLEVEIVFVPA